MPQYAVDIRTVENIIGYIKAGEIAVPEIPRPFVWDRSKIRDLIVGVKLIFLFFQQTICNN